MRILPLVLSLSLHLAALGILLSARVEVNATETPIPIELVDFEQVEATAPSEVATPPVEQKIATDAEELNEGASVDEALEEQVTQEERAAVIAPPRSLNTITPRYPRLAQRKHHEGEVTVEFSVTEAGEIAAVRVVGSSGYGELDRAALEATRSIHFAPATADGLSISSTVRMTFRFRLPH